MLSAAERADSAGHRTFRASSLAAAALQQIGSDETGHGPALLRQAIREASVFLANTLAYCKSSCVRPRLQDAFADESLDIAPLFAGAPRASLSRGETAMMRLLERVTD